jgi:hypothetical protein
VLLSKRHYGVAHDKRPLQLYRYVTPSAQA